MYPTLLKSGGILNFSSSCPVSGCCGREKGKPCVVWALAAEQPASSGRWRLFFLTQKTEKRKGGDLAGAVFFIDCCRLRDQREKIGGREESRTHLSPPCSHRPVEGKEKGKKRKRLRQHQVVLPSVFLRAKKKKEESRRSASSLLPVRAGKKKGQQCAPPAGGGQPLLRRKEKGEAAIFFLIEGKKKKGKKELPT